MANAQEIAHQVSLTLDGEANSYNISGIVGDIITEHGHVDIDSIDTGEYWAIVERHDTSALGVQRFNMNKWHRCPKCHAVMDDGKSMSKWHRYQCCQCGVVFARYPRLARFLTMRYCGEHGPR